MALAILFGLNVLRAHYSVSEMGNYYFLFVIGAIIVGLLLNSILFEVAHILGAKAGRYHIISVNVLGLLWFYEDEKLHVKFAAYDGLTGETKITPKKDVKKEPNPLPYLWFGTLFYLVEMMIFIILFVYLNGEHMPVFAKNIGYFLLIGGVIGGMILLYNILPLHLDSITDGYRLTMVSNAANRKAFNELLRVEYEISQGNTNVEIATFTEITNFTADLNLNKVYVLLDKREYAEAEKLIDIILAGKETISRSVYLSARSQKIYINLVTKSLEEATEFYEKEVPMAERRDISNDLSMASIRTYLLMSGMLDKSRSECLIAINNINKGLNRTPKQRRNIEISLFNEAIDKVNELHPKWELLGYKLDLIPEKENKKKDNKKGSE